MDLDAKPELVAAAREFVRTRLASWEVPDLTDIAVVIASELATNAVLHARSGMQVRLRWWPGLLRIEVFDENPRLPSIAPTMPEATSGRGLALVTSLASAWGIDSRDDGKVVWADVGASEPASDEVCLDVGDADTVDEALSKVRRTATDGA